MTRLCRNFIDSFARYMADKGSPDLYIKWSAIFALSAVMERKTWITTAKGVLYPK